MTTAYYALAGVAVLLGVFGLVIGALILCDRAIWSWHRFQNGPEGDE